MLFMYDAPDCLLPRINTSFLHRSSSTTDVEAQHSFESPSNGSLATKTDESLSRQTTAK